MVWNSEHPASIRKDRTEMAIPLSTWPGFWKSVARILEIRPVPTDDGETHWPPGTTARVNTIHHELETALQIVLASGKFVPGRYVADDYDRDWRLQPIL
jgi:hypothetical protein